MTEFFHIIERLGTRRNWRSTLESARRLLGLGMKIQLCVFGRLTKEHSLAMCYMVRYIVRLYRKSGARAVLQRCISTPYVVLVRPPYVLRLKRTYL